MKRPPLTINTLTRRVEGWEEFVVWSTLNDAQFNATVQVCDRVGLRELERLRALVGQYAHSLDEAREQLKTLEAGGRCIKRCLDGKVVKLLPLSAKPVVVWEEEISPAQWAEINAKLNLPPAPPEKPQ